MDSIDLVLKTKIEPSTSCSKCNKAWCCKWSEDYALGNNEWEKLIPYINDGVKARMKQAIADKEKYNFYNCAFLDKNNKCIAYKDRPLICRLHYSVSPTKYCNTKKYPNKEIEMLDKIQLFLMVGSVDILKSISTMYKKYKDFLAL